jgi:hypothetical protein
VNDTLPTLEAEWDEFVAELMPGFTESDLEPYRKCFLAGFLSMLAIASQISNRLPGTIERGKVLRDYFEQHVKATGEGTP